MNASGLIENVHLACFNAEGYDELRDGALAWRDGRIVWLGQRQAIPATYAELPRVDGAGGWLMGFVRESIECWMNERGDSQFTSHHQSGYHNCNDIQDFHDEFLQEQRLRVS